MVLWACVAVPAEAQVMGEEAELDRLRTKAEEALGHEDAEGAAMSMGRAAMMAARLAKRQTDTASKQVFTATEHLYRSQEHGYRAVALFRRAGGELPASAGVCGSLQLAQLELNHAQAGLEQTDEAVQKSAPHPRLKPVQQSAEDWTIILSSMRAEFQCPA
jgi:DNA-binding IclR family transcriptional regulator